jgi:hypothetical protein
LAELVVLLPGIGPEVVEILFTESVAKISTEVQEVAKIFHALDVAGIEAMFTLAHDISLVFD